MTYKFLSHGRRATGQSLQTLITHHSVQTPRQYRITPVMAISVNTFALKSNLWSSSAAVTASATTCHAANEG